MKVNWCALSFSKHRDLNYLRVIPLSLKSRYNSLSESFNSPFSSLSIGESYWSLSFLSISYFVHSSIKVSSRLKFSNILKSIACNSEKSRVSIISALWAYSSFNSYSTLSMALSFSVRDSVPPYLSLLFKSFFS